MSAFYNSPSSDGLKPLVNVSQVKNGWVVVVYHSNRDRDQSPEALAKQAAKKEEDEKQFLEDEKTRIRKELLTQLTSMALLGEAAGQAQARGIDKQVDPWKFQNEDGEDENEDNDDTDSSFPALGLSPQEMLEKMDGVIAEMASISRPRRFDIGQYIPFPSVETYIFTERDEMIKFVGEMLMPIMDKD